MTIRQIIWDIKKLLGSDSTILSRDNGERDIANRIDFWRMAHITKMLDAKGLSALRPEWMQHIENRRTNVGLSTPLSLPYKISELTPGGRIAFFDRAPVCRLYGSTYEEQLDSTEVALYRYYVNRNRSYGGRSCTSFDGLSIVIAPMVDYVSGDVLIADPRSFMVDSGSTTRPFDIDNDSYPVDGELAEAIIASVCEEFGVRPKIAYEKVRFNPNDGDQP